MSPHKPARAEWVVALAFLVLLPALAGLWAQDRQTDRRFRAAAKASCERGEIVRQNMRVVIRSLLDEGLGNQTLLREALVRAHSVDCSDPTNVKEAP